MVDGALRACQADPALQLLLVGPVEAADEVLRCLRTGGPRTGCARWPAPGTPPTHPANAGWIESGVRAAVLAVAQGDADAVVSAGSTGATVTSAALGLGRWPGVRRPALAAVLPTATGRIVLLDVGASVDPDEQTLASTPASAPRTPRPCTASKTRASACSPSAPSAERATSCAARCRSCSPTLDLPAGGRYIGLIEGNDVVAGTAADVVVTDGFTGNVLLKGLETAYALVGPPHDGPDLPPRAALLLGVAGTVVVCHGAATGTDVAAGIALAAHLHRRAAVEAIAALLDEPEVIEELMTDGIDHRPFRSKRRSAFRSSRTCSSARSPTGRTPTRTAACPPTSGWSSSATRCSAW